MDSDIDQHTTSHISDIYNHELLGGTYRRTESGGVTSGQIDYTGQFITPVGTMELVVGGQTLRIPLRITHDTQGRIFTHLHDPWPVTVDLDYTSYTITYRYIEIGQTGSNVLLTPDAGEDVLRVGLVAADRTALTTGTPTIFARYTEPTTNRVVEHLVSSVVAPTGTNQVNGQFGFQYLDLTLDGRTISGSVNPPTNTDVILLVNQAIVVDTPEPLFAVGTDGIVGAPSQAEVTAGEFLRADNTWEFASTTTGYSDVDGFAVENLGTAVDPGNSNNSTWPTGNSDVYGLPGYTYT